MRPSGIDKRFCVLSNAPFGARDSSGELVDQEDLSEDDSVHIHSIGRPYSLRIQGKGLLLVALLCSSMRTSEKYCD